ncbi:MAG: Glycine dehydrogenase (aminomethyl-transferring) [Oscillospiraceae bacterium]|jgi:sulfur relay (sulfurtransferase) complex TusBCD TusD component (DsrE family)
METYYYESNPDLRDYFNSLPVDIKNQILQSGVEISTLGELMKVAEHFEQMNKI